MPDPEEYDSRYEDAEGYSRELLREKNAFLCRDRAIVQELIGLGGRGPLLDVGAGAGIMLEAARDNSWKATGLELSKPSVRLIQQAGFEVHSTPIERAPIPPGSFGVVVFSHSLEHLTDPLLSLRSAHKILETGGLVHIAVPHWSCAKRWLAGKQIPWIFSEHISYFQKSSLSALLRAAGFEPVKCDTRPLDCEYDYKFAIAVAERFAIDAQIRKFLMMGKRTLYDLLTDNVVVDCPLWRFRLALCTTQLLLRAWPERLFSALGLGEELRVTARALKRPDPVEEEARWASASGATARRPTGSE